MLLYVILCDFILCIVTNVYYYMILYVKQYFPFKRKYTLKEEVFRLFGCASKVIKAEIASDLCQVWIPELTNSIARRTLFSEIWHSLMDRFFHHFSYPLRKVRDRKEVTTNKSADI